MPPYTTSTTAGHHITTSPSSSSSYHSSPQPPRKGALVWLRTTTRVRLAVNPPPRGVCFGGQLGCVGYRAAAGGGQLGTVWFESREKGAFGVAATTTGCGWVVATTMRVRLAAVTAVRVRLAAVTAYRDSYYFDFRVVLADAAESVRDAIGFEYCLASSSGWTKLTSPVLWAEIRESSLTGLELVQETTDKVVLVKEKPKAARDRQKSYVDYRRKSLKFEVGDRVLLMVSPWKGVVRFGKKGKLAPRYVGPFEIFKRIGLVAYRLRLPEELNIVHDIFHVSNLKKCLADANLHVPLDEIKVDKTLRFVEEPIEIMDREIKKLKRRKIALVKVRWNSKHGPEFTWEHEDQMGIKYPQLFVDRVVKPAS
ncbi:hypothetical protein Tco_0746239 [Tanacetum coccineum]